MQVRELLIAPDELWSRLTASRRPMAFVDLGACPRDLEIDALPPFPVVGLGDPDHPVAAKLDTIIEPPASPEAVMRQIARAPKAAAVAVQTLRALEGLDVERALTLESMSYGLLQGSGEHQAWLAARGVAQSGAPGRVRMERRDRVLHVMLDRPHARNAIDRAMRDALFDAFTIAAMDRDIDSVELSAIGAVFSIGGDLAEFGTTSDPASAHLIRGFTLPALAIAGRREKLVAHVQGACIGAGLEIAAFARRVTAAPNAWFQLPELAMGLIPGAGGCVSLPARIGRRRTALMLLSGRRLGAALALDWGLIEAIDDAPQQGRSDGP